MNQNIALFTKITAKSFFKLISLIVLGSIISSIAIVISIVLIARMKDGTVHASHTGSIFSVIFVAFSWFMTDFWTALLFFASLILFPVLYFLGAKKAAISNAMYLLCKNKISDWIEPKVTKYLQKVEGSGSIKSKSDKAIVKVKLLDANRTSSGTPKMEKMVLNYLFEKVSLDDVDLQNDNLSLSEILSKKIRQKIEEVSEPSTAFFWYVAGSHFILMLVAIIF